MAGKGIGAVVRARGDRAVMAWDSGSIRDRTRHFEGCVNKIGDPVKQNKIGLIFFEPGITLYDSVKEGPLGTAPGRSLRSGLELLMEALLALEAISGITRGPPILPFATFH